MKYITLDEKYKVRICRVTINQNSISAHILEGLLSKMGIHVSSESLLASASTPVHLLYCQKWVHVLQLARANVLTQSNEHPRSPSEESGSLLGFGYFMSTFSVFHFFVYNFALLRLV